MATVLLSRWTNTFSIQLSEQLGAVPYRSVDPASPVQLTRNGPLATTILNYSSKLSNYNILPIQSLRIGPGYYIPESSNHSLYLIKLDTVAAILREISEGTSY